MYIMSAGMFEEVYTLHDLKTQEAGVTSEPIIGSGILDAGNILLIHGRPKIGKTMLAMNLSLALKGGTSWLHFDIPQKRKVLYLQTEVTKSQMKARFLRMDNSEVEDDNNLFITREFGVDLLDQESIVRLSEFIKKNEIDVLIIDPFVAFHQAKDENNNSEMGAVMKHLYKLIQTNEGLGIILVHHDKKHGGEGGDANRGASAIFGAVDTDIRLTKTKGGKFRLNFELRNAAPMEPIVMDFNSNTLTFQTQMNSKQRIILDALTDSGPAKTKELIAKTNLGKSTVYDLVKKMHDSGKIVKSGDIISLPPGLGRHGSLTRVESERPRIAI